MLQKNSTHVLKITALEENGLGKGFLNGKAVLVKDTVPGDEVEVLITKSGSQVSFGRAMAVLTPSSDRTESSCAVSKRCGGCQLHHVSYDSQLKFKQSWLSALGFCGFNQRYFHSRGVGQQTCTRDSKQGAVLHWPW